MSETNVVTNETLCYLVKTETGVAIVDLEGNNLGEATITKDGLCYKLPANPANRQWFMIGKANKEFETHPDGIPLTYRPSRKLAGVRRIPNEKLIAFLSEDEKAEYLALINTAYDRMEAAKPQPKTEVDKLKARIAAAQAKLDAMLAAEADDEDDEDVE